MVPSESVLNDAKNVCGSVPTLVTFMLTMTNSPAAAFCRSGNSGRRRRRAVDTGDDELEVAVAHRLTDARGLVLQRRRLDAGCCRMGRTTASADASDGLWVTVIADVGLHRQTTAATPTTTRTTTAAMTPAMTFTFGPDFAARPQPRQVRRLDGGGARWSVQDWPSK